MREISDPDQVIGELKEGNQRFLEGNSIQSSDLSLKKLKDFAKTGQFPKAIVLCCSDSRAPVEMIFDQDIGDLFVIRVAGNIIAPSLVGSVEFAADTFGVNTVLVMGHTKCGAVTAALASIEHPESIQSDNIHDIVGRIRPHIRSIAEQTDLSREEKIQQAVRANVLASASELSTSSRLIEGLARSGKIRIVPAVLDLETGVVDFIST